MAKKRGIALPGYMLDNGGRIIKNEALAEAKLDLCTRLKRRGSKKVTVKRTHCNDFKK